MTIYDVVCKLIGCIDPAGATHIDTGRLDNLKKMIYLVEMLLFDINSVARYNKDRQEFSMKEAGTVADKFMKEVIEIYEEADWHE